MADEMYGDGGVSYAEKVFADQRERNRREAKKQEDFAKKLQLFDIGLRGVNFLINQRADNLEDKQIPAITAYKNFLESSSSMKNNLDEYNKSIDKDDYIYNYLVDEYKKEAANSFSELEPTSYNYFIRDEARKKVPLIKTQWDSLYKELADLPTFEEFTTNYTKYQRKQNPRSIFGAAGKTLKNLFKKETPASIKLKDELAKDAAFNSIEYMEIKEAKEAIDLYEKSGVDTFGVMERLRKEIGPTHKMIGTPITTSNTSKDDTYTKTEEFLTFLTTEIDKKGDNVVKRIKISEDISLNENAVLSIDDTKKLLENVKDKYRDDVLKILQGGGTRNLAANQGEAFNYIYNNPSEILKIDFEETENARKVFKELYSSFISTYQIDGTAVARPVRFSNLEYGYELKFGFADDMKKKGKDFETMFAEFLQKGNVTFSRINTTKLSSLFTNEEDAKVVNDIILNSTNQNSFFTMFEKEILDLSLKQGPQLVAENVNLNNLFSKEIKSYLPTKVELYYDIENQEFSVKVLEN
tara:strand:- start:6868 stop:8442 length:1575 start_codon:yes stop_codon:yes gene_type:complete